MSYNKEIKNAIIKSYSNGESIKALSQKYNISKSTLYNWIHQNSVIKCPNNNTITARQVYLMDKRINRLTTELEIWKKSRCTVDSPLSDKLKAIENLYKEYGVHSTCRVLDVKRSTFYHYLLRSPDQTILEKEDAYFKTIIREIFHASKGRIGSKKIRAIMVERGYTISSERVSRLMKEMELVCIATKKGIKHNFSSKGSYRHNKLKQQFEQNSPNRVWVSDITYLYVNYKPYYLCVIIDLFARKVIEYKLSANMDLSIALETFDTAYEKRGYPSGLLFHSDQGAQFSCYTFTTHLQNLRVKQSFSNPGCPYDNAVAESFFRSLKAEEVYHKYYTTVTELESSIAEYIDFFNNNRPHQKLGYKTPSQVEEEYFSAKKK